MRSEPRQCNAQPLFPPQVRQPVRSADGAQGDSRLHGGRRARCGMLRPAVEPPPAGAAEGKTPVAGAVTAWRGEDAPLPVRVCILYPTLWERALRVHSVLAPVFLRIAVIVGKMSCRGLCFLSAVGGGGEITRARFWCFPAELPVLNSSIPQRICVVPPRGRRGFRRIGHEEGETPFLLAFSPANPSVFVCIAQTIRNLCDDVALLARQGSNCFSVLPVTVRRSVPTSWFV